MMSRIWTVLVTGVLGTLLLPAVAWAEETGVAEELRKRRGIGGLFGGLGLVCCLGVVAAIVLVVFLVNRNRNRGH